MVALEHPFPRSLLDSKFHRLHADRNVLKPLKNFAGFIFVCSNETLPDLDRGIFGLPAYQAESVRAIRRGMPLFLFNYSERRLYGVFEATSDGGLNLDPHAWENTEQTWLRRLPVSRYPAQVRVCLKFQRSPLDENIFRPLLDHFEGRKFRLELTTHQVRQLLKLFQVSEAEFFGEKVRPYANNLSVYDPDSPRSAFKLDSDCYSECSSKGTYNGEEDGAEDLRPEDRVIIDNPQFSLVYQNKDYFLSNQMNQMTLNDVQGNHVEEAFTNLNGLYFRNPELKKRLDCSSLASVENSSDSGSADFVHNELLYLPTKTGDDVVTLSRKLSHVQPETMMYIPVSAQARTLSNIHKGDDARRLSDRCIYSIPCNNNENAEKSTDSSLNIPETLSDDKPHHLPSDVLLEQFSVPYPLQLVPDQYLTLLSPVILLPNGQFISLLKPPVHHIVDSGDEGDVNGMPLPEAKLQTPIGSNHFQVPLIPTMWPTPALLELLHLDILRFAQMTRPSPDALVYVQSAIDSVRIAVKKLWCDADLEVFGSFATGLCLQHSDIDLAIVDAPFLPDLVNLSTSHASVALLRKLGSFLASQEWCESFNVIATASVPVLKCHYRHIDNISDPTLCSPSISIDITIGGIKGTMYEWCPLYRFGPLAKHYQHTGGAAREYVLSKIQELPALAPLVLLLKSFLHHKGLSNVYFGGLGSYSLTLLVAFYLERNSDGLIIKDFHGPQWSSNDLQARASENCSDHSCSIGEYYVRKATETVDKMLSLWESSGVYTLGKLLQGFLVIFGFEDLASRKIILKGLDGSAGGLFNRHNRHIALWIDDPLRPGINVGAGSFGICDVQASFREMLHLIIHHQFPTKPLNCNVVGCQDMAAFGLHNNYILKLMTLNDELNVTHYSV